jgi:glycosyltransferase involved in cell wall biosynthesis
MRIGLNCIDVNPDYVGGVNTYVLGIVVGLHQLKNTHSIQIYVTSANKHVFQSFEEKGRVELFEFPVPLKARNLSWKAFRIGIPFLYEWVVDFSYSKIRSVIEKNSDVVYTPTSNLLYYKSNIPSILSMHDIQHDHFPEFFSELELKRRKMTYRSSAKHAHYLQASSRYIKEDFISHFNFLKPEQVFVISEGVNNDIFKTSVIDSSVLDKYKIPRKFLFYPAQLWHHKNHLHLLKALIKVKEKTGTSFSLVLTGQKFSASEKIFTYIEDNKISDVLYLGKVPLQDLISIYHNATIVVTSSLHESSSLPIFEAAASGTAIVASNIPPNVETAEHLSINIFERESVDSLAETLVKVWNNEELRKEQINHNLKTIDTYSWKNIALQYVSAFEKIYKTI